MDIIFIYKYIYDENDIHEISGKFGIWIFSTIYPLGLITDMIPSFDKCLNSYLDT
jgi:hypothetical protein